MTTNTSLAPQTDDVVISYAIEAAYNTKPALAFKQIRATGETLAENSTMNRPAELNSSGEVSAAVQVSVAVSGAINYDLSFGTYDDFLAVLLRSAWQTAVVINGVAADITITVAAGVITLSSTTANKFASLSAGQYIKLSGFTDPANAIYRIQTKTDTTHLILSNPYDNDGNELAIVTETPAGTAATIKASTMINGKQDNTIWYEKAVSADQVISFGGVDFSQATLTGSQGNFLSGSFTAFAASGTLGDTEGSTGAVVASNTLPVMDPVGGFLGAFMNEVPLDCDLQQFTITLQNTGAASQYAMGSATAKGRIRGLFQATGQFNLYFQTSTAYEAYKANTSGRLSIRCSDSNGNAYVLTFLNMRFNNPQVVAQAPNGAVMIQIDVVGNPQATGGTFQIDRLAA